MIRHTAVSAALTTAMSTAMLAAGVGCNTAMYDENIALHRQNRELQDKLDSANAQLRDAPDPGQFKTLTAELVDRDKQIADLRNQPPPAAPPPAAVEATGPALVPATAGPSPFGDLETKFDPRAGTVTVTLPGDVLFAPGQADLKPAARSSLDKLVAALGKGQYAGRPIRVEGHTDADPIRKTAQDWTDNLDLSLGRAAAVSRYLEAHGISPKLVTTSGFGPYRPRGANKARNRRVDVVVVTR